jgi:hypothetical protein
LYVVCRDDYYRSSLLDMGLQGILARLAGGLLGRSVSVVLSAKPARKAAPAAAAVVSPAGAAPAPAAAPGVARRLSPELAKVEKRKAELARLAHEESIALRSVAASLLAKQWAVEDREEAQQRAKRLERIKAIHAARLDRKNGNKGSP